MSGAGWYKMDGEELLYGPNFVIGPGFELRTSRAADQASARVANAPNGVHGGWRWFDSEDEARAFYGRPMDPFEYQPPRQTFERKDPERGGGR